MSQPFEHLDRLDYLHVTAAELRDDRCRINFLCLSMIFALAGLETVADLFTTAALPEPRAEPVRAVIRMAYHFTVERVRAGEQSPPYIPPAYLSRKPGITLSAYHLHHNPTPQMFEDLAAVLQDGGHPDLAAALLAQMPRAIAAAAPTAA